MIKRQIKKTDGKSKGVDSGCQVMPPLDQGLGLLCTPGPFSAMEKKGTDSTLRPLSPAIYLFPGHMEEAWVSFSDPSLAHLIKNFLGRGALHSPSDPSASAGLCRAVGPSSNGFPPQLCRSVWLQRLWLINLVFPVLNEIHKSLIKKGITLPSMWWSWQKWN